MKLFMYAFIYGFQTVWQVRLIQGKAIRESRLSAVSFQLLGRFRLVLSIRVPLYTYCTWHVAGNSYYIYFLLACRLM